METVLIIEDDTTIMRGLRDNFQFQGYTVKTASDGEKGLQEALKNPPDLIILDVMLPGINGYEICRFLREEKLEMPIIMLTAKADETEVILGLKLGADDYVTKPFSIKELLARSEAFLRRRRDKEPSVYNFGDCVLNVAAHSLLKAGEPMKLSPKEFDLLHFFLKKAGQAVNRDQILNAVWGYECLVTPRSIDRFVNALRQKIEPDPQHPLYLQTVREFGYKFVFPAV